MLPTSKGGFKYDAMRERYVFPRRTERSKARTCRQLVGRELPSGDLEGVDD